MPIPYFLIAAAQIFFVIHAARTGRPYYWMFIIFFIPMMGILAYVVFELLPGATTSSAGARAVDDAKRLINPERTYKVLASRFDLTPTVENSRALAEECVRLGRLDEAESLYRNALTGLHATDPILMLGLARVHFAKDDPAACLDMLAEIRAANPDYQNAGAHMLYARSLEGLGRNDEALREYSALSDYVGGEEPRVRRALLLNKIGDIEQAQTAFMEVKRSVERSPSFYRRNQRSWYRVAQQNLKN